MPRYHIDLHDGTNYVKDTVGFDLPDRAAVRTRLVGILTRYARNLQPDEDRQDLFAIVRDETGRILYRGHLSFDIETVESV